MTDATVAIYLDHSLDVKTNFTAKITLYVVVVFDLFTELCDLFLGKVLCAGIGVDSGYLEDLLGRGSSDAVNIGQSDFNAFCVRNINACYTSHVIFPFLLTLSLFVLGILANYHYASLALDDFALFANLFNGWLNLHFVTIPFLFSTPGDSTLCKVVDGNLNGYLISRQYPYIVHSEFARNVGCYDVSVRELNLEVCVRQ